MTRLIQSHDDYRGGNPSGPWWYFIAHSKTVIFRNFKNIKKCKSLTVKHFGECISVIYGFSLPGFFGLSALCAPHCGSLAPTCNHLQLLASTCRKKVF